MTKHKQKDSKKPQPLLYSRKEKAKIQLDY